MAQVLVPGVAQLKISGLFGTQPWACVTHWRKDTPPGDWSIGLITALANTASSAFNTQFCPHMDAGRNLNLTEAVDIGAALPQSWTNASVHPGTGVGAGLTSSSICTMINFKIGARYKGGHPRIYLPIGLGSDTLNNFQWSSAFQTAAETAMVNFVSAVATAINAAGATGANHCVPTYTYEYHDDTVNHKYTRRRIGLKNVYTVQTYDTMQKFGTQRRRLEA